jgi:hypothetical protein
MQGKERTEFAVKLVEILVEKGTEGLSDSEKEDFLQQMRSKMS